MSQAELFPLTEAEQVAKIRHDLQTKKDGAKNKRDDAAAKLSEAESAYTTAAALLDTFDRMSEALKLDGGLHCTACNGLLAGPVTHDDDGQPYHESCWAELPGNEDAGAEDAEPVGETGPEDSQTIPDDDEMDHAEDEWVEGEVQA